MTLRLRLCIPVFDNPETIGRVICECVGKTDYPVLVVDDGSRIAVAELLARNEAVRDALAAGRLEIVRHPENLGKGAALLTAFRDSLAKGFTHLLTLDGDGQHLCTEIPRLVAEAHADPWAMVIGNRRLEAKEVPGLSRFGRRFSNFWVRYQTGTPVHDSQCGMRVYPLFFVQSLSFWTRRYDFEIEVLIRLLWRDVRVREIPIAVHYPEPSKRVSHFRKFRDNLRISLLNTLLVTLRLLKSGYRPGEGATAVGLGVVVGCTPFFGLHAVIATLLGVLLRLNVPLLIAGTQISIPPLAPVLAFASVRTGLWLNGLRGAPGSLWLNWLFGSVVVGTVLGVALGLVTYVFLARMWRTKHGRKGAAWNGRMRGGVGNHLLKGIATRWGLRPAYFCLNFVVPYFYLFAPRARRGLKEYWRRVSPDLPRWRRPLRVLGHMRRFGELLLDRIVQAQSPKMLFQFRSNGFEYIKGPLERKEGVILLGAHVGGWDLASSSVHRHDLESPFHVLQYGAEGMTLSRLKEEKEPLPAKPVFTNREEQPLLTLHRLLDDGQAVALMGDRPVGRHVALVPFFGSLAPFDTTPFKLAAATGKPLVFTFGFKGVRDTYDCFAAPARYYRYEPGSDRDAQCVTWAEEFARHLEQMVRRYPDQWTNFYPFWSTAPTQPPVTGDVPC